jgi:hypothetical protein
MPRWPWHWPTSSTRIHLVRDEPRWRSSRWGYGWREVAARSPSIRRSSLGRAFTLPAGSCLRVQPRESFERSVDRWIR